MQILGLLGMYFDAVVVEVKTFFNFIQIDSGHTVTTNMNRQTTNGLETKYNHRLNIRNN